MEVENDEDRFLDDATDTDDSADDSADTHDSPKTNTKTVQGLMSQSTTESNKKPNPATESKPFKIPYTPRLVGKSDTIRLAPIPRAFTESHIYEWIQSLTDKTPLAITIKAIKGYPQNRINKQSNHPLYDAQNAYVIMASAADASFCAPKIHGKVIPNTTHICECRVAEPTKVKDTDPDNSWVSVTGLSKITTEQDILSHIQQKSGAANKPKTIRLVHHKKENYAGIAYVECANPEDAAKCVENLKVTTLCGSKIWCVRRAFRQDFNRKPSLAGVADAILVGNLHYTVEGNDVFALCAKYGQVKNVELWFTKSGYRKGMASVTMNSRDGAKAVFEGLHGEKVKHVELRVGYFQHKDNRKVSKYDSLKKLNRSKASRTGRGRGRRRGGRGKGGPWKRGGGRMDGIGRPLPDGYKNRGFRKLAEWKGRGRGRRRGRGGRGRRGGGRGRRGGPKFA